MSFTVLDYFLLVLLGFAGFLGLKRGFFSSMGAIASMVGGIIFAFLYREEAISVVEKNFGLSTTITEVLNRKIPALATIETVKKQVGTISQSLGDKSMPISSSAVTVSPGEQLATIIISVAVFLALFMIASVLLRLFFMLLNGVFNRGPLGVVNRIAGLLLEVSKYAIIVVVLIIVVNPLLKTAAGLGFGGAEMAMSSIEQSYLISEFLEMAHRITNMIGIGA